MSRAGPAWGTTVHLSRGDMHNRSHSGKKRHRPMKHTMNKSRSTARRGRPAADEVAANDRGFEPDVPSDEEGPALNRFSEHNPYADDALGLYLQQMGAVALLNRDEEL